MNTYNNDTSNTNKFHNNTKGDQHGSNRSITVSKSEAMAKIKHLAFKQNIPYEAIENDYVHLIVGFSSTWSFRTQDRLTRFLERALCQAPIAVKGSK